MTNEQINRAITKSLGKCWHEWERMVVLGATNGHICRKCEMNTYDDPPPSNTDYTTDANACVELWKTTYISSVTKSNSHWTAIRYVGKTIESGGVEAVPEYTKAPTFCLAICKAYLKSKGVELEDEG